MTIRKNLTTCIHDAQQEALKEENLKAELLRGMEKQLVPNEEGTLYFMGHIWVPLFGEARGRQKSYADRRRKPLAFDEGDMVLLKVSPWKGVARFGKRGKLNPRYIFPFKILEKIGTVEYKLELPEELNGVHDTFHMSNLKKSPTQETVVIPTDEVHIDDKLRFTEEPVEVMDWKVQNTRRSRIKLVKVRWNSKHVPEYTWEREDQFKAKYRHLFQEDPERDNSA
ncbi:uncharacterized protein LOC110869108 [Helianthus annuus]|uniref:uncharacterized protein LOC110869108 n=1 Tax=Helianthus annuus TaxID=4232 RepID=UPI001652FADB|nr:uncharacterized protein LOC110869108 [Helianthus annuus]